MNKLPVGGTIRAAYRFALGELGTIIGLIWVPMLAIAVLTFLPYAIGDANVAPEQNPTAAGAAALRGIVFALATFLLYACIYVSVTRQALGLRQGGATVYFMLGRAEFRMLGALVLLGVICVVLVVGFALAVAAVSLLAAATGNKLAAAWMIAAVFLTGAGALIFAVVRLAFLLAPVTVAEDKISFERGWTLTARNFWRILIVMLAVSLPVIVVIFVAFYLLMGQDLMAAFAAAPHLTQTELANRLQTIIQSHAPATIGINLIVAPFSLGLSLGASAAGYRALAGAPPHQTGVDTGPLRPA